MSLRQVSYREIVNPDDSDVFIRLTTDRLESQVAERMLQFSQSVEDLGVSVSTGRVVDFRARKHIRRKSALGTVPLIYPGHFEAGFVSWPKSSKKPEAIENDAETEDLLVPADYYVLVKRFSSKEEKRRVVAALYDPTRIPASQVGFENHLNYIHSGNRGLPAGLARGLVAFLNSTLVDSYFRQFSGHTQVNATDLRSMRYPTREELDRLGERIGDAFSDQEKVDSLMAKELMATPGATAGSDPIQAKKRIAEALEVLKGLGMPSEQQNDRSALTLLSLLDLKPETAWHDAGNPMRGITEMMKFFERHYGKVYAPNTRETVRRFTVHQFEQAGFVLANPDRPERPTNSPKAVYQIESSALELLRCFGKPDWEKMLGTYRATVPSLVQRYAQEREMQRVLVKLSGGKVLEISPGGQNELIRLILGEFCERFTPGAMVLYVGDTAKKWAHFEKDGLEALGVKVEEHGKMPDVVVYHAEKGWLVLIEAVTSHGPMNPKRHDELKKLFKGSSAGLVFVTAFMTRKAMLKYLGDIAWETEVWVAESPSHLIHFNGLRFLGPYTGT